MDIDRERLRDCEAREWHKRYLEKVKQVGLYDARIWLSRTFNDIERKRGHEALLDLRTRMNKIKNAKSK